MLRGPKRSMEEVRVKDKKTGGEKGSKLARFSLIPPDALWALAEHYGRGAKKYADRNWEKGYDWSLSLDALERHLRARQMGEKVDAETGSQHLTAVIWHALALWVFDNRGLGTDNVTVPLLPEGRPAKRNARARSRSRSTRTARRR